MSRPPRAKRGYRDLHPTRRVNGQYLCRFCSRPCPGRRTGWCSDACVREWKIQSDPGYARWEVFRRDHGVCAGCGVDTVAQVDDLVRRYRDVRVWHWETKGYARDPGVEVERRYAELLAELRALKVPPHRYFHRTSAGLWDADHIVPVAEGGGGCGLDNYRTLCLRCHYHETRKLKRRLSRRRSQRRGEPVSYVLFDDDEG